MNSTRRPNWLSTLAMSSSLCLWLGSVAVSFVAVPGMSEELRETIFNLLIILLYVPPVLLANRLRRSGHLDRASRRAWWLFCWAFGVAIVANLVGSDVVSGLLGVAANLLGVGGLLAFPVEPTVGSRRPRRRRVLDALITFAGAMMLFWTYVLFPRWTSLGPGPERLADIVQLCLALVCLITAASVLLGRPARHVAGAVWLMATGIVVLFGFGLVLELFEVSGLMVPLMHALRGSANVLFTMAAVWALARASQPVEEKHDPRKHREISAATALPYVFMLSGYALLVWKSLQSGSLLFQGLVVLATLTTVLVTVRQGGVLRDSARLSLALGFQATHDELTGVLNRRALFTELRRLDPEAADAAVSLLLIDVDHFKQINDTRGHEAGDQALRAVVDAVRSRLRRADLLFRLGGDEFVVILPRTSLADAERLAAAIGQQVQTCHFRPGITLSLSIGVTIVAEGDEGADQAMIRADEALYAAKEAGRGCFRTVDAGGVTHHADRLDPVRSSATGLREPSRAAGR